MPVVPMGCAAPRDAHRVSFLSQLCDNVAQTNHLTRAHSASGHPLESSVSLCPIWSVHKRCFSDLCGELHPNAASHVSILFLFFMPLKKRPKHLARTRSQTHPNRASFGHCEHHLIPAVLLAFCTPVERRLASSHPAGHISFFNIPILHQPLPSRKDLFPLIVVPDSLYLNVHDPIPRH